MQSLKLPSSILLNHRPSRLYKAKQASCFVFGNSSDNESHSQSIITRKCLSHQNVDHQNNQISKDVLANYLKLQSLIECEHVQLDWFAQNLPDKLKEVDIKQLSSLGSKYQFFLRRNKRDTKKCQNMKEIYSRIDQTVNSSLPVTNEQKKIEQLAVLLRQQQPKLKQKIASVNILSQKSKQMLNNKAKILEQISYLRQQYFNLQRQLKQCQASLQNKQKQQIRKNITQVMKTVVKQKESFHIKHQQKNKYCQGQQVLTSQRQSGLSSLDKFVNLARSQFMKSIKLSKLSLSKKCLQSKNHLKKKVKNAKLINQIIESAQNMKKTFLCCIQQLLQIQPNLKIQKAGSKMNEDQLQPSFQKLRSNKRVLMHRYSNSNCSSTRNLFKTKREVMSQLFAQKCPNTSRQVRVQFMKSNRNDQKVNWASQINCNAISQNTFNGKFDKRKRYDLFSNKANRNDAKQFRITEIQIDQIDQNTLQSFKDRARSKQEFRNLESIQVLKKIIEKGKVQKVLNLFQMQKQQISKLI